MLYCLTDILVLCCFNVENTARNFKIHNNIYMHVVL